MSFTRMILGTCAIGFAKSCRVVGHWNTTYNPVGESLDSWLGHRLYSMKRGVIDYNSAARDRLQAEYLCTSCCFTPPYSLCCGVQTLETRLTVAWLFLIKISLSVGMDIPSGSMVSLTTRNSEGSSADV